MSRSARWQPPRQSIVVPARPFSKVGIDRLILSNRRNKRPHTTRNYIMTKGRID
jgi:hypothetical protein